MKKYKAIVVDDEKSARNILVRLLTKYSPEIEIIAECKDVKEAVVKIKEHQPDLVFLDIEMPDYSGYEIVSFFDEITFEIIFVTAFDNYAIKAFELSALDYLLKPIDISRLKTAVSRFKDKSDLKTNMLNYSVMTEALKEKKVKNILVQMPGGQKIVSLETIIAIEANEAYSYIITSEGTRYTYSKHIKYFEKLLSQNLNFIRTHKSWIINIDYLKTYSKSNYSIELTNGTIAKLSRFKKGDFEQRVLE